MKPTGKHNKFTGEEIMQVEEHDIAWHKEFDELSFDEKANFLSFIEVLFLSNGNRSYVEERYSYFKAKNCKS